MNWAHIFFKVKTATSKVFVHTVYDLVVLMWISYSAPRNRDRESTVNPREYLCYVSLLVHVFCLSICILLIAIY